MEIQVTISGSIVDRLRLYDVSKQHPRTRARSSLGVSWEIGQFACMQGTRVSQSTTS